MDKKLIILVCLVLISSLTVTGALAQNPEPPDTNGEDLADHMPGEVLIRFNPWINSTQATVQMEQLGLKLKREIPVLGVKLVKLPPGLSVEDAINQISHRPGVEFVEPNYILQIAAINQEEITDQWGLQKIEATQAWSTFGEGQPKVPITLATVDSGIDPTHNDLSANIWSNSGEIPDNGLDDDNNGFIDDTWGWDFVNNDNDPFDDNLHGTAVSSVMAGDLDGDGVAGVCPWCQVMAVKVMTAGGTGTLDVVANGIIYAANADARVINLSLAGIAGAQTLQDAVDYAWSQGSLVVAGAGNDGVNAPMYPAGYANAMAIGSTGETDTHSCFSNYGEDYISVVAPGENILIAIPDQGYAYGSGTSLSTPFVAGLGGLLFSQDADRTNSEVRSIIESTAVDLSPPGVDAAFGYGRIDAYRAVTNDQTQVTPPDGLFSTDNTATGYAHARKLVRDSSGILHMIWHTKEGTDYRIRYATSDNDGLSWNLESDVFSETLETYHPAIATDGQNLFVAIPSRSGVDQPYQILFTRKALPDGDWLEPVSLMGGTYDAVRPDIYYDPNNEKLHLVASSFDNAPYVYYQSSEDQGASWNSSVAEINPSTGTDGANSNTRYATIHANGNNIYIVSRTFSSVFFTYYYMHSVRSTDGGQTWFDQFKISSYTAFFTGEYGISLAGVGDRVYMGYEVGSNMYFRYHDGTTWSPYETLELGDADNVYKWPTITQADDGQAWLIFELNGEQFLRHYDGSTWAPKESVGTGNYANLKLGTNSEKLEWVTTQCNGAPFLVSYDSRNLGANNPPHADDQAVSTNEDSPFVITLTGSDPDDDPLTYSVVSGPTNGSLNGTAPDLTYTPDPNYNGMDSFNFLVNDGMTNSNTATVTITVTAVNDSPVADEQVVTTDEDTAISITLTASDVDGDSLTFSVVTSPVNGTLSGTAPNLTYTPNPGYSGSDSFTFKAIDGSVDSNTATVSITVTEVNNPPVADDQAVTTDEDTPVSITLTANDLDGDPLTYSVVSDPTNGILSGTAPNLTYTPDPDFNGTDSFTFLANDGVEDSNVATVDITVTAVNDSPVANPQSVTTDEDTAVGITLTAYDADGDSLTYSIVVGPTSGTLSGTMPGLTYTPSQDYNGLDSFTFKVHDGTVDSNTATVSITISAVNDSPVADDQEVTTDEDTEVAITLTGSDVDGDDLTFSVLSLPAHGSLSGTIPNLIYTPDTNYNGPDSFNFNVDDGNGKNDTATVMITVTAVNDPPVADDQDVTTEEDISVDITLTASDVDGDSLTYSVVVGPANGSLSGNESNLTYTPDPDYNGGDSFTFLANDGTTNSNIATVTITITAVNDPPVANPQSVTTDEDTPVAITLTGSDIDSGSLIYSVVAGPANGTLSGTEPNLTYTSAMNYNGLDSFTFKVSDGIADSDTATIDINVTSVNNPPVADDQAVTTDEDTSAAITLTASDVDSGSLTFSVLTDPTYGSLSGTAPDLTYTPNENYNGTDSFTFKASDESLDSNTATVSITVTAVNDSPVAYDQEVYTDEDTPAAITLTASDVDSGSLTFSVLTDPTYGSLSGTAPDLTYTPNENYNGTDSFTFKASDESLDSNTGTVSITVTAVNDSPVAYDQEVNTDEDTPVAITLTASDVDSGSLTFSVLTGPTYGSLSGTPPILTYTPNENYNGTDSFTFKASDESLDSNTGTVSITVKAAASVVDAVASGEIFGAGTVSGDYMNTHEDDGVREAITERDSGGKPINRFSYLEHKWTFEVTPGNVVTLYANAWSSGSIDGDSFIFAYSTDDTSYTDMFVIDNDSHSGYVASYTLPASILGTVYVRVTDSDHSAGNREQNSIYIDHLYIRSETQHGDPPAAPSGLNVEAISATQIKLSWIDNSLDEYGFQIEHSLDGSSWSEIATVGENVISYSDMDLSSNTTYYYRVRAYNSSGSSDYSDVAYATTPDGLSLAATGYKVKGVHVVDLEWSGSAAPSFFIYRDGVEIAHVTGNDCSDNTGNKGGASYQYKVCEADNPMNCSNTVRIDF